MYGKIGLTSGEVALRERLGQINKNRQKQSNSYLQIIRRNVFTFFNLVNLLLAMLILLGGINLRSLRNVLFLGVVISNSAIGLFQEIRAKRATDRLKVLTRSRVTVLRDGAKTEIFTDRIVLDDVIMLSAGGQVPADCRVLDGNCVVDESVLTGEADGVNKSAGSELMSGSFIISGACCAKVTAVGKDSYGNRISNEARSIKSKKSDIVHTMNIILAVMSVLILPLGTGLFILQYKECGVYADAIIRTAAAVIGMLPEGMVLLASTVFAVVGISLARKRVLSQDLYSAEALARTDVICLDKTGTLTEGRMEACELVPLCNADVEQELRKFIAASSDCNQTANALRDRFGGGENTALSFTPFDSERKCSAAHFEGYTLTVGAPEYVLDSIDCALQSQIDGYLDSYRVLLLASTDGSATTALALILLNDVIRKNAAETLRYFYDEGVNVKIISGDNAKTVASIARRAGVKGSDEYADMRNVQACEIAELARKYTVFGRVSHSNKRALIAALKADGHTVTMVGDGVNDTVAMREADCAVAPASATDMARDAAKLVLLDSDFAAMPEIVRQGRRSINNLKRSVSLFLIKIVYSLVLSVAFLLLSKPYPFEPIHLTLITFVSVAAPGFLLSFEPNSSRVQGKFIAYIITRSLPGGIAIAVGVIFSSLAYGVLGITTAEYTTACVIASGVVGLINLMCICLPFTAFRFAIFSAMIILFGMGVLLFGWLFSLTALTLRALLLVALSVCTSTVAYILTAGLTRSLARRV